MALQPQNVNAQSLEDQARNRRSTAGLRAAEYHSSKTGEEWVPYDSTSVDENVAGNDALDQQLVQVKNALVVAENDGDKKTVQELNRQHASLLGRRRASGLQSFLNTRVGPETPTSPNTIWQSQTPGINNSIVVAGDGSALLVDRNGRGIANLGKADIDNTIAMDTNMSLQRRSQLDHELDIFKLMRSMEEADAVEQAGSGINRILIDRKFEALGSMPEPLANALAAFYQDMDPYSYMDPSMYQSLIAEGERMILGGGSVQDLDGLVGRAGSAADAQDSATGQALSADTTTLINRQRDRREALQEQVNNLEQQELDAIAAGLTIEQEYSSRGSKMGYKQTEINTKVQEALSAKKKALLKEIEDIDENLNSAAMLSRRSDMRLLSKPRGLLSRSRDIDANLGTDGFDHPNGIYVEKMLESMKAIMSTIAMRKKFTGLTDPNFINNLANPEGIEDFLAMCADYAASVGWEDGGSPEAWRVAMAHIIGNGMDFDGLRNQIEQLGELAGEEKDAARQEALRGAGGAGVTAGGPGATQQPGGDITGVPPGDPLDMEASVLNIRNEVMSRPEVMAVLTGGHEDQSTGDVISFDNVEEAIRTGSLPPAGTPEFDDITYEWGSFFAELVRSGTMTPAEASSLRDVLWEGMQGPEKEFEESPRDKKERHALDERRIEIQRKNEETGRPPEDWYRDEWSVFFDPEHEMHAPSRESYETFEQPYTPYHIPFRNRAQQRMEEGGEPPAWWFQPEWSIYNDPDHEAYEPGRYEREMGTTPTAAPTATEVEPTATEVEPTATEVEPTATEVEPTARGDVTPPPQTHGADPWLESKTLEELAEQILERRRQGIDIDPSSTDQQWTRRYTIVATDRLLNDVLDHDEFNALIQQVIETTPTGGIRNTKELPMFYRMIWNFMDTARGSVDGPKPMMDKGSDELNQWGMFMLRKQIQDLVEKGLLPSIDE